ncbi:ornithine cyclodeaminase family protein [Sedimentitalea todarodis]|uniref:Ornithine cyclodeaminase family protein n=1 Tax=Sedimentitalea todarodis TaxID=1631240 RepID=A0ABU3VDT5_9RHOB|nr:ornithine cyclodeaminase family protein [Sedimentitalea todarodis]MDU9004347.1 ornithine cyclodeaminase family protein [Sedimentitalea todarodis]
MIVLTSEDVAALLPIADAIEIIETTMKTVSAGGAELPLRNVVPVGGDNRMGVMPGALSDPACFGVKLVSLFPDNPARGLSSHSGAFVLFDAVTGQATAMMDASLLTAIRTAAATAVATRALARSESQTLTIIGYGEQAEHHLAAICAVREIQSVHIAGRNETKARAFCKAARSRHPDLQISAVNDVRAAVEKACIVCTVTASPTPVLDHAWLDEGCHVNVVGSSIPSMREVDDDLVLKTSIWVDYLPSALAQAGEIVDLIAQGRMDAGALKGEIGHVLSGHVAGRTSPSERTVYRSLGIAAQDLAAAQAVLSAARERGMGQTVRL